LRRSLLIIIILCFISLILCKLTLILRCIDVTICMIISYTLPTTIIFFITSVIILRDNNNIIIVIICTKLTFVERLYGVCGQPLPPIVSQACVVYQLVFQGARVIVAENWKHKLAAERLYEQVSNVLDGHHAGMHVRHVRRHGVSVIGTDAVKTIIYNIAYVF